uniref:(California timema) hypothetical protein n=1 Tax=Timema californicum TaxID=61474 RepID=A0A7R9P6S4_TIMCA|nr:unnamed protein product [Timema californicum]
MGDGYPLTKEDAKILEANWQVVDLQRAEKFLLCLVPSGIPVDRRILQKKYLKIAAAMVIENFSISKDRISHFKHHHSLVFKKLAGESVALNISATDLWFEGFMKLLESYETQDINNEDETEVVWTKGKMVVVVVRMTSQPIPNQCQVLQKHSVLLNKLGLIFLRNPKMELNKSDLLKLLSYLEATLAPLANILCIALSDVGTQRVKQGKKMTSREIRYEAAGGLGLDKATDLLKDRTPNNKNYHIASDWTVTASVWLVRLVRGHLDHGCPADTHKRAYMTNLMPSVGWFHLSTMLVVGVPCSVPNGERLFHLGSRVDCAVRGTSVSSRFSDGCTSSMFLVLCRAWNVCFTTVLGWMYVVSVPCNVPYVFQSVESLPCLGDSRIRVAIGRQLICSLGALGDVHLLYCLTKGEGGRPLRISSGVSRTPAQSNVVRVVESVS